MDNEKLIAQISASEESQVDKVGARRSKNGSVISRMQRSEELRKKTIFTKGVAKSRFTKLRIQENFESIKENLFFEYGESFNLNLKNNEIEIYSRWIEGSTLADINKKEQPIRPEESLRLRNKLRLWVRIFEHLSFYHTKGIIHGNLKPENILVRDRAYVDIKTTYDSEFFDKKDDVPYVVLLDGGYSHLIEFQKEILDYEMIQSKKVFEKQFWLAPESHGFIEGAYKENSDVFSLAAIMAWDLGILQKSEDTIFSSLWPSFQVPEQSIFILGGSWYKWTTRNVVSDVLKRLRVVLLKALDPIPEKRNVSSKDLAFEIMLMANRLPETSDGVINESSYTQFNLEFTLDHKKGILAKNFDLPEKIISFGLEIEEFESNRLWIDARNQTANKYALMRSINTGFNIIGKNTFYFGIKFNDLKIPFSCLDSFCNCLFSYVIFLNPSFLHEIRTLFFNLGNQVESIFFALPSLRKFSDKNTDARFNSQNLLIQVRHESIHNNIETIINKIIQSSKINFFIIDDINRSDDSSLSIILKIINKKYSKIKWIIGIRSEEGIIEVDHKNKILQMKQKDLNFSSLKDDKTSGHWLTKLNALKENESRLLSSWAVSSSNIDMEMIEIIGNKISSIPGIISTSYHEGKKETCFSENKFDDYVFYDEIEKNLIIERKEEDIEKLQNNKDNIHISYDVLKRAIHAGIISENRDILSGKLICYYWEHQFVLLSLSLLLNSKIKSSIYFSLIEYFCNSEKEILSLEKIIQIADRLMKSDLSKYANAAYCALVVVSEEICDIYSANYIINKLQILEEMIEIERPKEASLLVPKIREKIADLCRSLGKFELAEKYYQAVSWNVFDGKDLSVLLLKNFFPSNIKNKALRTTEFLKILKHAQLSNFFDMKISNKSEIFFDIIKNEVHKIQKKLSESDSFVDIEDKDLSKDSFKKLIKGHINNDVSLNEKQTFTTHYKPIRETVMSHFFRSSIGWIDNSVLSPYIVNSIILAFENNDGESTIHLLFSLLLTSERNISVKLRSQILEIITDLAGRIGNGITLYEVLLMRSWSAFFYDGNLQECKKNLERISSAFNELPLTLRQCARKIQILCELESSNIDLINNINKNKYIKKMDEYDLSDWNIGYTVLGLKQVFIGLKVVLGDGLFLANILSEKIDQILLYTYYLFEGGHANASSLVCAEAKNLNIRSWFLDPSSHIEYAPENIALKIIEYTNVKSHIYFSSSDSSKKKNKFIELALGTKIRFIENFFSSGTVDFDSLIKKGPDIKYWGEDKAILNNIRIERAKTQDTEKLHFLAQNSVRAGFMWTAFRLAHKARTDLTVISNEIQEMDLKLADERGQGFSQAQTAINLQNFAAQKQKHEKSSENIYEKSHAYPEQGIAINYILEFLHNFQSQIQNSKLSSEEILKISDSIKKSIPTDTDLIESTLAGALKASAKRIQVAPHGFTDPTKGQDSVDT